MSSVSSSGGLFVHVIYAFYILLAFFIPAVLMYIFARVWIRYVRADYNFKQKSVLLELKMPKEITKSPAAMELFFTALYQTGAASHLETYWQGKTRPVFSFELVSLEGKVKFFIWTRLSFKNIVESQIYAQYPNVEIYEVPDYTDIIEHAENDMDMWGTYFIKEEKEVYPIKSYVDYGLDEDPKEEFKIDPMTSVLEYLGSLGKDEYAWIQILAQAHKEEGIKEGRAFDTKRNHWKHEVQEEIQKIREETTKSRDPDARGFPNPTKAQQEVIAAMERNLSKFPFECCIRGFYFGKAATFNSTLGITGLIGSFRQYSSSHMNTIKLGWFTDHIDIGKDFLILFNFFPPFRRWMRRRRDKFERHMLEGYKEREGFEAPFTEHHQPFILTTEELATMWHFPGTVATTPTFDRIMAKKAEAPSNLPI